MNTTPLRLVAYGDCNTLGFKECEGHAYPEQVAKQLNASIRNLGYTMSTTRELLQFARDNPPKDFQLAIIQYGLVDSWLTFKHSPYVLYYPNNPFRKLLRKLVKKIKKYARILKIHDLLGSVTVVPLGEYIENICAVIKSSPSTQFYLVSTAPNLDTSRNPRIETFNASLKEISQKYDNAHYVETYTIILPKMNELYYTDGTHLNADGQKLVAEQVIRAIREQQ